jgi:hypothetical protein
MDRELIVITLLLVTIGAVLAPLFHRLLFPKSTLPVSTDWIYEIPADTYLSMNGLLNEWHAPQPGFDWKMRWSYRAERRRAFRVHLQRLIRDYNRASTALRLLMTQSDHDRPDLAALLMKQRIMFLVGLAGVEWRLALHTCGVDRTMEMRDLVHAIDALGRELRRMVPAGQHAPA